MAMVVAIVMATSRTTLTAMLITMATAEKVNTLNGNVNGDCDSDGNRDGDVNTAAAADRVVTTAEKTTIN